MAESPDTNPIPLPSESLLPPTVPASPWPDPPAPPARPEPAAPGVAWPEPPSAHAWPEPPSAPAHAWPEEEDAEPQGPWEEPWAPAAEAVYTPEPAAAPAGEPARRGLPRPEELLVWGGFTTLLAVVLTLVTGSGVARAAMLGGLGAAATGVLWLAARSGGAPPA